MFRARIRAKNVNGGPPLPREVSGVRLVLSEAEARLAAALSREACFAARNCLATLQLFDSLRFSIRPSIVIAARPDKSGRQTAAASRRTPQEAGANSSASCHQRQCRAGRDGLVAPASSRRFSSVNPRGKTAARTAALQEFLVAWATPTPRIEAGHDISCPYEEQRYRVRRMN